MSEPIWMTPLTRELPGERLADPVSALRASLDACGVRPSAGRQVALAVGSRGIAGLPELVAELVRWLRSNGAEVFLVPAMGSHGGATAEGQREVLEGLGLGESAVGAPIRSTMDVVELPRGRLDVPVYLDAAAAQADAICLINRVKPHTSFHGPCESGLMKMLAIGLGKQRQAQAIHARGVIGLRDVMPDVARQVLADAPVLLGVAVVENARDQTLAVEALAADEIPRREPALLDQARANMPSLPVDRLDVLIVDRMGKDISGLGMDPNVIGRLRIAGCPEPDAPAIRCIIARDLTDGSHGNAAGVGLADVITARLAGKIDRRATYANVLTTTFCQRAFMPLTAESDAEAVDFALRIAAAAPAEARILRIQDTLHLQRMQASAPLAAELLHRPDVAPGGEPRPLLTGQAMGPMKNG